MVKILEKTERRLGEQLHIKGERCLGPKCALARRPYPPGVHGKGKGAKGRGGRGSSSEYGIQLKEKQKMKFFYGLREKMLERYFTEAFRDKKHSTGDALMNLLEKRLDNVLYRAGFAQSRSVARHLIGYGHVRVNNRTVNLPSYSTRVGEVIDINPKVLENQSLVGEFSARVKKVDSPAWMKVDKDKRTIEITKSPYDAELIINPGIKLVIEYYSR